MTTRTKPQAPNCPTCGSSMAVRTAKRGQNKDNRFWGCSNFSSKKCKGTRPIEINTKPDADNRVDDGPDQEKSSSDLSDTPEVIRGPTGIIDRFKRWDIGSSMPPDATGRWDPEVRRKALRYVYRRDDERCGICGREMPLKGAQVEHIVPKVFGYFDVRKGGQAVNGDYYKSAFHKLDNLQAAHSYCNKRKGNKPDIKGWRHKTMPPLVVAIANDDKEFIVPY